MESEAAEVSPNPSTKANPGNRLKSVLSKTRRDRNNNASKVSVTGTEDSSEGNGTGVRNSIDSLIDKSRQSSLDDGSSRVKLAKLIPGHKKRKKKRQEAAELAEEQDLEEEEGRGRRTSEQPATAASLSTTAVNRSHSTLGDEASSLITVDSDAESPLGSPPPLVSHQSHIGYLTASSPLIKTSNTADPSDTDGPAVDEAATSLLKSSTIPWDNQIPGSSNLAPRHAATLGTEQAERSSTRSRSRDGRGISPGTKFKDVFSTGSRKKDTSPTGSPDRESTMSNGSGNGLGAILRNEKRNSISFRKGSKPSDIGSNTSYSQQSLRSPNQSIQSLPNIVTSSPKSFTSTVSEAPVLTTTPPTPTEARTDGQRSPTKKSSSAGTNANTITSASGNMISHRRIRSDSATHAPSKLSNAMSAPLTPTVEEVRTPGGRTPAASGSPSGAGGFFSSVFSAAQNAASTFTNTIANNPPRPRSSAQNTDEGSEETLAPSNTDTDIEGQSIDEKKPLAIDTLGSGDLSLSHLGIASDTPATANSTVSFPLVDEKSVHRDEAAARVEDASAARAVSAAYSEVADDLTPTPVAEDNASVVRPRSFTEKTTPNGSVLENELGSAFKRSGSVRSRVGAVTRRKRNSSAATAGTGNTIAAGIGAGHNALTNPAASASTQKLSGFNVANKKRNRDFHQLFRSVPDDDYLIEDYSCALQREIILAGRIYVSEGHICFSSNILGWVTTLIISFDEVVSVEKENTAMIIPNAIAIQTLHARHTFRSLLSREATYDLIIGLWKLIHPNLKSTLNGAKLDAGDTGDKTEKADPSASDDGSEISEEEEEGDVDEEDDNEGDGSVIDVADGEAPASEAGDPVQKTASRKASAMGIGIGQAAGGVPTLSEGKAGEKAAAAATAASVDFPGPATHPPTECGDADTHYEKVLKDDVVPAPLGKVFSMTFGPASGGFMSKWLLDEMKVMDLQMEDDKKGLSEENKSRTYSYIKPLYASIGPKQTKCIVTETLDAIDLEKAVSITSSTQTPDVPSGNVFIVKTRCCLMWASGNSTRILMSCTIEWSGKSWLKGPIEKGANDGQSTHANDLVKALKAGVTSRARAGTVGSKAKTKGKRAKGGVDVSKKAEGEKATGSSAQAQADTWGLFEPLHGLLGPIVDIFKPFVSANMIIGILLLFIIISWLRGPTAPAKGQVGFPLSSPERIAAYEEIWRKEESDLWDWLEQRIGMEGIAYPASSRNLDQEAVKKARTIREKSIKGQSKQARLAMGSMKEREVDHAIRVTEERLRDLKGAVQRKREENAGKKPAPLAQDSEETPSLLEQTVGQHFASIVSRYGDRTAVVSRHQQTRLSYEALDIQSNALARGLINKGVKKGDRVAVSLGNNIEYAVATYAIFKLGAILVPLNPAFNVQQIIAALAHLEASHLIIGTETNLPRKNPRSNVPILKQLLSDLGSSTCKSDAVPSLRHIIMVDNSSGRVENSLLKATVSYENLVEDGGTGRSLPDQGLHPSDIVNIQFTSGTTSTPKAACLSHRSILNNGASIGDRMLLTTKDIICCPPPLFHCFGCILGYMASATHGSCIVFPSEAFDPYATLRAVQEERCTALYGVPTMFIAELELLQNGTVPYEGFQHLRTGIAAGSSIPAELMRKLHKILNLTELTICYGMTETSPVSAMTTTDDPIEKRINSVGRLLPHVEAKVVDPQDRSKILAVGQKGELAVHGYLVMKEYWGAPERTAEVMLRDKEGKTWMHTGDEAEMDKEGYVKITGRIKDIIIKGGENIHPLEVENCLLANPGVREVSVVGLPDEKYGEVVAAFVVPVTGEKDRVTAVEVRDWVREKLSHHLVPKYVFWTDGFPKTASGKIQKFKLKEEGVKLVGEGKGLESVEQAKRQ